MTTMLFGHQNGRRSHINWINVHATTGLYHLLTEFVPDLRLIVLRIYYCSCHACVSCYIQVVGMADAILNGGRYREGGLPGMHKLAHNFHQLTCARARVKIKNVKFKGTNKHIIHGHASLSAYHKCKTFMS